MLPLDTGKARLRKIDYDILSFVEYPKTIDEIRAMFPGINPTAKIIELMEKGLVEERKGKYVSKFHTNETKRVIEEARIPIELKRGFNFFLSQIDNPFVRENILDSDTREKSTIAFSIITKSTTQELTPRELVTLRQLMDQLLNKLR
ncbi:MAG: hypothetical protein QXY45_02160 [Candidatus Aenigmatarchaeota archaeon]